MQKAVYKKDQQLAYCNRELKNLRGERWKEIPGLEELYLISSYGRVRSLPRLVEAYIPSQGRSISYYTKERILTVKVHSRWNTIINGPYYECTVAIHFGGREKRYMIARLVYHGFVKEIDFETDGLMIMHRDGNGLNNHYTNLEAGRRSQVTQRAYDSKRHISPFARKSRAEIKQITRKAGISRQKPVIQFSLKGRRLKRYASIKEAAAQTGIREPGIIQVLKGRGWSAGGYVWGYEGV